MVKKLNRVSFKADVAKEATTALVKSSHDSGEKKEDSAAVDFLRKEVNGMHERVSFILELIDSRIDLISIQLNVRSKIHCS